MMMQRKSKQRYSSIIKQTQYQNQSSLPQHFSSLKFKTLSKIINKKATIHQLSSDDSGQYLKDDIEQQSEEDQKPKLQQNKGFNNLIKKLDQKRKMKVGTRNFQKSFYSKLANKIVEKPMSFYKFGLKEDEKVACKSVFKELFHIQSQKLKGTFSTAQLWDNKTSIRYLKQNQMFFNKDVLLKQFQDIDKQQKLRKKEIQLQKQKEFVKKYRQLLQQNKKINQNNFNYQQVKQMNANEACSFIRNQIDKLVQKRYEWRIKTKSRKIIASLEKNYQKFDQLAGKFKSQMVILL